MLCLHGSISRSEKISFFKTTTTKKSVLKYDVKGFCMVSNVLGLCSQHFFLDFTYKKLHGFCDLVYGLCIWLFLNVDIEHIEIMAENV